MNILILVSFLSCMQLTAEAISCTISMKNRRSQERALKFEVLAPISSQEIMNVLTKEENFQQPFNRTLHGAIAIIIKQPKLQNKVHILHFVVPRSAHGTVYLKNIFETIKKEFTTKEIVRIDICIRDSKSAVDKFTRNYVDYTIYDLLWDIPGYLTAGTVVTMLGLLGTCIIGFIGMATTMLLAMGG